MVLPKPISPLEWLSSNFVSGNALSIASITGLNSSTASNGQFPASKAFCAFWISFARPTYCGSFLESANSASPSGLERKEDVSPDGISSSVVVTGSWISDTTFNTIFSGNALIAGQSLMFGPNWISTEGSATPLLSKTRFA